ncbi:MAG: phage portal protein family protein [Victivallaceae bacterium]
MLYDANGRIINESAIKQPASGSFVTLELSDRQGRDVSRDTSPEKIDAIMTAAAQGDCSDQCQLAMEIEEKSEFVCSVLPTRRQAVLGLPYEITPGDDTPAAKKAAEYFAEELDNAGGNGHDTFGEMREDLLSHLVPGIACTEIVWKPGGKLGGFKFLEARHLTFRYGYTPRLIAQNAPSGVELEPNKFIVHKYRRNGGDVSRGGLIRPLAWLHCFANLNLKDLLRFIERYGMPFTVAKVDKGTWDTERNVIKRMIRGFGPDGGAVLTRESEIELLQAANNTGDVYFKILEYLDRVITRIVLGQTATSGEGSGWSKGSAQGQVRQDILEYDAKTHDNTLNSQLAAPWAAFNFPGVAVPKITTDATPPEDIKQKYEAQKMKFDAMGVAIRAGLLTATADIEETVRKTLDLPELDAAAVEEWKRNQGVKRPITLVQAGQAGPQAPAAPGGDAVALAADSPTSPTSPTALNSWLTPLASAMAELSGQDDPDAFGKQLAALSAPDKLGKFDDQGMIDLLAANAAKAAAEGFKEGSQKSGVRSQNGK